MADLKKLKGNTGKNKKKVNSKMAGVDLDRSSEIMSPQQETVRIEKPKDLNFKVSAQFHKQFKQYALMHDMSMKTLLEEAFTFYTKREKQ